MTVPQRQPGAGEHRFLGPVSLGLAVAVLGTVALVLWLLLGAPAVPSAGVSMASTRGVAVLAVVVLAGVAGWLLRIAVCRRVSRCPVEAAMDSGMRAERELKVIIAAARHLLEEAPFETASQHLHRACRELTGAVAGYIALLNEGGTENELLFLEEGGFRCTVDPGLPMPIRGLRAEAYRTGEVVWENEFSASDWMQFLPDGHVVLDNVLFAPLMQDGRPVGLLGVANKPGGFDADDARLANVLGDLASIALQSSRNRSELLESERRYRALFETAVDSILVVDAGSGEVVDLNSSAEALTGLARSAVVGARLDELLELSGTGHGVGPLGAPDEAWSSVGLELAEGRVIEGLLRAVPDQAVAVECSISATVEVAGRPVVLVILRDISERRELEERLRQSEKLDALGRLAGGVAHDFNNQLGAILGFAELLKVSFGEGVEREYVENIAIAADRAGELTQQLLAFSRRGAHRRVDVDINDAVADVASLLGRNMSKEVRLSIERPAGPCGVLGDPDQIRAALLNLGLNAGDAMPDGGELHIRTEMVQVETTPEGVTPELAPGEYVRIVFWDTGRGMDDAVRTKAFEPFFTTKPTGTGTGMGLPAVYGTVSRHNGGIRLESKKGQGTSISVYLPAHTLEGRPALEPCRTGLVGRYDLRVMVVDDESLVREMLEALLERLGCEVSAFANGREAIEHFRVDWQSIDLVVLDMIMPEISGHRVFTELRAINPEVKVLISSGHSVEEESRELLAQDNVQMLQKPYGVEPLCRTIELLGAQPQDAGRPAASMARV